MSYMCYTESLVFINPYDTGSIYFLIFTDKEAEKEITLTKVTQLVGVSGT